MTTPALTVKKRWTLHRLHKWAGLIAALWLAVLGISGLLLDHRHGWRWLWQSTVSDAVLPGVVTSKAQTGIWRIFQIDPENPEQQVAGGPRGLWWTTENGTFWKQTHFINSTAVPAVTSAIIVKDNNHSNLWLATDEGLWLSRDFGITAHYIALKGKHITALTYGQSNGLNATSLLGVEDRSRIFQFNLTNYELHWLNLSPLQKDALPQDINLSRWVHDLHFGRGFLYAPLDLWINDFSGAALFLLPMTGFLFWYLPKRWRRQKPNGPAPHSKKITMKNLLRIHSSIVGILLCVPIVYLSLSGILLDHGKELRKWMKSVSISQAVQTPVYSMRSWANEIYAVAAYPEDPNKISLGTRLGLFSSKDMGQSWYRESNINGFVWTLRRIDGRLFLGGMGVPNKVLQNGEWHMVKKSGHMPTDITTDGSGNWYWLNGKGVQKGNLTEPHKNASISFPQTTDVPWYYVLDALHNGTIFTKHWKWVNDFFAILALFLVISGLIRWWRKKWV